MTMTTEIHIKKLHPKVKLPKQAHDGDAGFDIFCLEDIVVYSRKPKLVKSGFALELPQGWEAQIRPRSGLALNKAITVLNSPGTIDAGYRGEVGVILINHSNVDVAFKRGDKIAQMVIKRLDPVVLVSADDLGDSNRGTSGFGSTDDQDR